jgi:hypothetical protein
VTAATAIIRITACPAVMAHTLDTPSFAVLDWAPDGPVIALHGQRVTLSAARGWKWEQIGSER